MVGSGYVDLSGEEGMRMMQNFLSDSCYERIRPEKYCAFRSDFIPF